MEKIDGINSEILESLYHGNGCSLRQISNIFGYSINTIKRRMIEYGIPRRSNGGLLVDFTFNDRQKEIFDGCMLGDGGLGWYGNNCYFCNGDNHKEYLIWLQKQIGVEDISNIYPNFNDGIITYFFSTRVIPSIQDDYKKWYPNGKGTRSNPNHKIIPNDIELTPIKLLFWYVGDGNYYKREDIVRFSNSLILDDWLPLSKKISKVLNVNSGISINKHNKDKDGIQRYYLRLNRVVTNKFFDMVDSLDFDIPECYQYKFGRGKLCQNEN